MLRCAQHDSVWITVIITRFTIIVTGWLRRPLNGLEAVDTMRVNRVMMFVIHTSCHAERSEASLGRRARPFAELTLERSEGRRRDIPGFDGEISLSAFGGYSAIH